MKKKVILIVRRLPQNQITRRPTYEPIHRKRRLALEDRELIRRIQNGQTEYLNTIAQRYYDDIYYFCCYQTGNREDSYDLAQDTFLRFIRYIDRYQYRNLKVYLLTIAMNLCREYLRQSAALSEREIAPDQTKSAAKTAMASLKADRVDALENAIMLSEALMQLPEIQREAVLLHHFYGYKNREIARMTGASYSAVKSRIRQGLEKLSRLLTRSDFKV